MRALWCESWAGYQGLTLADVPEPALRPGCVRIAVAYATISAGQLLVVAGKYQRKPPLPFVPGTEVSGVVIDVAPDVTRFVAGDRVAASLDWGGYGEVAVATAETTWHVPDGVDLQQAAVLPLTYGTAWAALHWRGRIEAGQTLLVFGAAGGVGLPAVELGRLAGAQVIAVAGSAERAAVAAAHGAQHTLVHGRDDDPAEIARRVNELTDGRGADIVFEPIGGVLFNQALRCCAPEGRVLVIGFVGGTIPQIPANILLVKNIEVIGFNFGLYVGWTPRDERRRFEARVRTMMDTLHAQLQAGAIRPATADCWDLADHQRAFAAVESRQTIGRAMLRIAG